jgi:hypothetical protein
MFRHWNSSGSIAYVVQCSTGPNPSLRPRVQRKKSGDTLMDGVDCLTSPTPQSQTQYSKVLSWYGICIIPGYRRSLVLVYG